MPSGNFLAPSQGDLVIFIVRRYGAEAVFVYLYCFLWQATARTDIAQEAGKKKRRGSSKGKGGQSV